MAENVHSKYLEFLRGGESSLGQLLDEALKRGLPMEGRAGLLPFRDTLPGSVMNERSWALPGVLAGAVNAFSAPGRALTGSDPGFQQGPEAMNFAGNLLGSSLAAAPLSGRPRLGELGITAYHGSPHKFDAFDASKIGTGEGAQAYGHGLYLAENPKVAQDYAKQLGGASGDYVAIGDRRIGLNFAGEASKAEREAALNLIDASGDFAKAKARVQNSYYKPAPLISELDKLEKAGAKFGRDAGFLYKADIPDAMIQKMLDWDKPLSQQSQFVIDALKKQGMYDPNKTGAQLMRPDKAHFGIDGPAREAEMSKQLAGLGIPGIRYLDQGSRAGGQGTSNYVVFPGMEQNVKILEKK